MYYIVHSIYVEYQGPYGHTEGETKNFQMNSCVSQIIIHMIRMLQLLKSLTLDLNNFETTLRIPIYNQVIHSTTYDWRSPGSGAQNKLLIKQYELNREID
jgi:hypothetical protein